MQPLAHLRVVPKGHVSVRDLARRYGVSKSTLYDLIRTDPTFPYLNVGLKKRIVIDAEKFELWLENRTERQKDECFGLPTAGRLLEKFKK